MKKLIYLWVNNYKNVIIQQGYQLSPEILIQVEVLPAQETGTFELSILMIDNRSNVLKNFYGQNISSIMAFVGKNGSGKTMVSRMLLEYLPDSLILNNSLSSSEFLQASGLELAWDSRALYVLYDDENDVVSVCPHSVKASVQNKWDWGERKIQIIEQPEIYTEVGSVVKTGIYLTNVFNPSELLESYPKLDLGNGTEKFQQTYSPAFLLKHEAEEQIKGSYGYHFANNKFIGVIQKYAQGQVNSLSVAFMNKQAALFLKSFYHIPGKWKDDLQIYQKFGIDVVEFGTQAEIMPYINPDGSFNELYQSQDFYNQTLIELKRIYLVKKSEIGQNVLILLYFNMLLEVYGVFGRADTRVGDEIGKLFEGRITDIDVEILDSIKDYLWKNELRRSDWGKQIAEFIDFLQDTEPKSWMGETGTRSFAEEKKFLDWYYAEITKETSFVKRNIIFRWKPTSSGEMALANLFAYLDDAIQHLNSDHQNVLLILDELDCYLHPRWQQKVVKAILEGLQEYTQCTFQVVITSHSPILLSDFCHNNILKLNNFEAQLETQKTLGADISRLYYDSFFMEEGDIGDFAKQSIAYAIEELKKELWADEKKLRFIIENIGQDIVRERLRGKYQLIKKCMENDMEIAKRIHQLDRKKKEKVLEFIKDIEN